MKSIAIAITVAVLALIIVHEGRSVSAQIIPPEYRELAEKITIIRDMEGVELIRIRGHLTLWGGGIHHAEIKTAVRAGVPAPDG